MRENREHTDIKLQEEVKIGAYWWKTVNTHAFKGGKTVDKGAFNTRTQ